ncbi:4'-phosphopantetheinyl transferase superfamily protein [Brevibacillus antibioticus]|uniref:4'-phosphopantetheinyl transferase superfamily protein n=1 Tax=Brevibacillus antibioticus TaxID=2570228 RepID=A0A4U2Y3R6_9BACL|nr:4'-phosphopantetheinyl transferase superfamily protein [Brevibacillus antibioticus]TKI55057.1 4'-phosphopantetheinyl transferase superfamily protein [Brevibacillus antibioticus]
MMNIYAVKCPAVIDPELYNSFLQGLSKEKQERVSRYRRLEDSYRALLADVLVRSLISEMCEIPNEQIEFVYNAYGKPSFKQFPSFCFNVSHSGEWVVCITHVSQVGIDVEQICSPVEFELAERFFASTEVEDLFAKHPDEQLAYFYDLWTLKESYIKAVGKGLSIPLQSFSIRKHPDNSITLSQQASDVAWCFRQYEIDPGYKLSACGMTNQFADQVIIFDLQDLHQKMFRSCM